jgi:hypothetical protein
MVVVRPTVGGDVAPPGAAEDVTFAPAGNIEATDVQAALVEVDAEKADIDHDHDDSYEPAGALTTHADDTTAVHGISDTAQLATQADLTAAVDALVDAAPGTLDTLNELAAALGDDANFASTITTTLAGKAATTHDHDADYSDVAHDHDADYEVLGGVAAHTGDGTGAHAASAVAFDPTGSITATDVQGALEELDADLATPHDHDADYEASGAVATHAADTTDVHGIADTSALALSTHDHDADYAADDHAHSGAYVPLPASGPTSADQILGLSDDDPVTPAWIDAPSGGDSTLVVPAIINRNTGGTDQNYALPGWYTPSGLTSSAGGFRFANTIYWTPIYVAKSAVFDRIGIHVGTAGTSGSVTRLGIYTADASTLMPSTLVQDFGTVASDSNGQKDVTINLTLAAGTYWIAACSSTNVTCHQPGGAYVPPFTATSWSPSAAPGFIPETSGQTTVPGSGFAPTAPAVAFSGTTAAQGGAFMRYDRANNP